MYHLKSVMVEQIPTISELKFSHSRALTESNNSTSLAFPFPLSRISVRLCLLHPKYDTYWTHTPEPTTVLDRSIQKYTEVSFFHKAKAYRANNAKQKTSAGPLPPLSYSSYPHDIATRRKMIKMYNSDLHSFCMRFARQGVVFVDINRHICSHWGDAVDPRFKDNVDPTSTFRFFTPDYVTFDLGYSRMCCLLDIQYVPELLDPRKVFLVPGSSQLTFRRDSLIWERTIDFWIKEISCLRELRLEPNTLKLEEGMFTVSIFYKFRCKIFLKDQLHRLLFRSFLGIGSVLIE
jgi:hypothetical protein